jgi:putative protease
VVAGVKSFKIEGRLKGPEYVAITTRAYRLAVDEAWRSLHEEKVEKEEKVMTAV